MKLRNRPGFTFGHCPFRFCAELRFVRCGVCLCGKILFVIFPQIGKLFSYGFRPVRMVYKVINPVKEFRFDFSVFRTCPGGLLCLITFKVVQKVNSTTIALADNKVTLGDENATEPLVLGNELAQLMLDFMTECSKIMTPTLMGTMTPVNFPNFISLSSKIQKFLSKTSFTK